LSVIGTGRGHVEHLVHTVHLFFNGCGHIVGHNPGIGAGIDGGYPDLRRGDLGILGHGNVEQRNKSGQGEYDRYHHGQARAFNENL